MGCGALNCCDARSVESKKPDIQVLCKFDEIYRIVVEHAHAADTVFPHKTVRSEIRSVADVSKDS